MTTLISLKHINKFYSKQQVLNDINLDVKAGQILGLVGPNGAGKTTCLHALLGLTKYDGDINVLGNDPRKNRSKMLENVAYISDVAVLPKWLSAEKAIAYMQTIHPQFDPEKAATFLGKTNIPLDAPVKSLSKGMVTQLHLALVLAIDAKVLVLDEPTLGLDILTRRQFYNHLLEDFYDETKCIIVTTHQIEEIEHILTDVAFIRDGELVLNDSVDAMRQHYQVLTVSNDEVGQVDELKPLYSNSIMGLTSMLLDKPITDEWAQRGKVTTPTLADIFVGIMSQEKTA